MTYLWIAVYIAYVEWPVRIAYKENFILVREKIFHQINASAAVNKQKNITVFLVLIKAPLKSLHAHDRRHREYNVLVPKQMLQDLGRNDSVDVNIANDNYSLSGQQIEEIVSQIGHKHI